MELLTVGRVSGTHHLKGAVKVSSEFNDLKSLNKNKVILELANSEMKILTVQKIEKLLNKKWVAKFEEITDINDALQIQNSIIKIRKDLFDIEEDNYSKQHIQGMNVYTVENEYIGEIVDIYETPAHNIYVIEDEKYETMIPDVDVFIKDIDFNNNKMIVNLLDGMRELKK